MTIGGNEYFLRPYMDPDCPDYLRPAQFSRPDIFGYSVFNPHMGFPSPMAPVPFGAPPVILNQPIPVPYPVPSMRTPAACDSFVKYNKYDLDDGKISFKSKMANFGKGLIRPVTTMFSSPANFIKGALGIAACAGLIVVTGGAAAPVLVAAGVATGGVKFIKGASNAMGAKTDAEAELAWQDIGEGTGITAASVAGSKAALKKAGVDTTGMSYFKATQKCFTSLPKQLSASWKTASCKLGSLFSKKPDTVPTEVNSNADAKLEARMQAERQAKIDADAAQAKYNKPFEDGLSHKSAKESAAVFEKAEIDANSANSTTAKTPSQTDKFRARQEKANLDYMYERKNNATTPAAKKALQAQYDIANKGAQNQIYETTLDFTKKGMVKITEGKKTYTIKLDKQGNLITDGLDTSTARRFSDICGKLKGAKAKGAGTSKLYGYGNKYTVNYTTGDKLTVKTPSERILHIQGNEFGGLEGLEKNFGIKLQNLSRN